MLAMASRMASASRSPLMRLISSTASRERLTGPKLPGRYRLAEGKQYRLLGRWRSTQTGTPMFAARFR